MYYNYLLMQSLVKIRIRSVPVVLLARCVLEVLVVSV